MRIFAGPASIAGPSACSLAISWVGLIGFCPAGGPAGVCAALDPANYEFAPAVAEDGLLRVGLTPRRKDAMLIDGAMFLSPEDADLVRLEGRLVKPPSFWTRQVKVVRRYGRNAGVRVPLSMESTAKVLIVGTSTFAMSYRYLSVNGRPVSGELGPASSAQVCAAGAGK